VKLALRYLRVSTPGQVHTDYDPEGISIPSQRHACERKEQELAVTHVEEFVEPGRTGTRIDKRPEFQKILARIHQSPKPDYLVVYSLSRFARNRLESASVLLMLRQLKITLVSATENIDESPVGQLTHGMLDAVNEFRSASEGADIKYKMGQKARLGGTLMRAPIGYRNVRELYDGHEIRTVAIDEEQAPLVLLAFELYATGQYSIIRLVQVLSDRGLRHRPRRHGPARPVSRAQLHRLLSNPYYCGYIVYEGIRYAGRHQALVSEELFRRVQAVLAEHRAGERQRVHNHYLKGLLWCARCERRMIFNRASNGHGGQYDYYFCRGRQEGCDQPYVSVERIEQSVQDRYRLIDLPSDLGERLREKIKQAQERRAESTANLRKHLSRQLADLDRREDTFLDLAGDGALPRDKLKAKLEAVRIEKERCQRELAALDGEWSVGVETIALAVHLLTRLHDTYQQAGPRTRRRLNQTIFERILIDDRAVVAEDLAEPFDGLTYHRRKDYGCRRSEVAANDDGRLVALDTAQPKGTRAARLAEAFFGDGSSNAALVEVLNHYSSSTESRNRIVEAIEALEGRRRS